MRRGDLFKAVQAISVFVALIIFSGASGKLGNTDSGVSVSPATVNFRTVPLMTTTAAMAVTFTNSGSTDVNLTSIAITGDYSKSGNCGKVVTAGASCTINIKFAPTVAGSRPGTLTFTDSDPSSPQVVNLAGIGLGPGIIGGPLSGLTSSQTAAFNFGFGVFNVKWDPIRGLGPVFNQFGCFTCHGGGSNSPMEISGNTSNITGTRYGKWNPTTPPTFNYLDGSGDPQYAENEGGPVLHTQTVVGLSRNVHNCSVMPEVIPADATVVGVLRSPQLFGLGLVDSISDATIMANIPLEQSEGLNPVANMVPDQNGVTHVGRFGQKAQFPTLLYFILSAQYDELGITSPPPELATDHLPQGKPFPKGCAPDPNSPEDVDGLNALAAYQFVALLAPVPTNSANAKSAPALKGKQAFETVGCPLCHIESMQTDPNATVYTDWQADSNMGVVNALANQTANLYSDLLLHDLGPGLSGGIPEGQASLTQWRTAPLWGLSSRRKFGLMHDLRTTDVDTAIRDHGDVIGMSDAAKVIQAYEALSPTDQANLIAFLGTL